MVEDLDVPHPKGQITLRLIAQPQDANAFGDITGGWVISKMDQAAEACASQAAHGRVAMVSTSSSDFIAPVKLGSAMCCYTHIKDIGNSSITVEVEAWTISIGDEWRRKVTDCTFVYVAIDEDGRIRKVPK